MKENSPKYERGVDNQITYLEHQYTQDGVTFDAHNDISS